MKEKRRERERKEERRRGERKRGEEGGRTEEGSFFYRLHLPTYRPAVPRFQTWVIE